MKNFKLFFLLFLILTTASQATYVAVLETSADGSAKDGVSLSDRQYLTNVLREQAVKELPAVQNYTIMTRENIQQMLPPGKAIEDCEGSCLVETGKNIAADFICQARVGRFGKSLTLSAELYETAGNKLIASFNGRGENVEELLELIKKESPAFFRNIKGTSGFAGVSGIGALGNTGDFSYGGKKKFIVEITSEPTGAVPTIDGKAVPKCLSTPCKVQVEEGNHRIVASLERYDDAETIVDIKTNNQKIDFQMVPNFGWLEIKPVLSGNIAKKGKLTVMVDGARTEEQKIELEAGIHKVMLTHPCYDPTEFNVSIAKNKTEIFDKELSRGNGGLELAAENNGEPQSVAMFIDGVEVGSTPYAGVVPLCADVRLKGEGWTDKVAFEPKWHEVVHVTHQLTFTPDSIVNAQDSLQAIADSLAEAQALTEAQVQAVTDTVAAVTPDSVKLTQVEEAAETTNVGESVPANVNDKPAKKIRWIPIGIGAGVFVVGTVLAIVGNNKAKSESKVSPVNPTEYKDQHDKIQSAQTLRNVGITFAILGAAGVGISFLF
ncbi:MAG: PEGA domain-containing protein [Fibrobacter sp.]|nr:PEGA domain-containing protein [Fibrobacter sp.]MBQ5462593.1 PEGA domain-containing protein [Fibrobacter sp.]